jgi:hypothetical protein
MSRRTKLITTALFLVLLAIPAAYVAFTWSPENPLRIRITSAGGNAPLTIQPLGYYVLPVEVKNTSSTPVNLVSLSPSLVLPFGTPLGDSAVELPFLLSELRRSGIVIPPHSTVPASLRILGKDLAQAERTGCLWARYVWISGTKAEAIKFTEWISFIPPVSWYDPVPHPRPDYDDTPVEISKGTAASFGLSLERP